MSAVFRARDDRGALLQGRDTLHWSQSDFSSVSHVRVIIANCCRYPYEGLAQPACYDGVQDKSLMQTTFQIIGNTYSNFPIYYVLNEICTT